MPAAPLHSDVRHLSL